MLVIGRRPGEECLVLHKGEVLRLLVWTDQHHIKVGFDAPKSFTVMRAELKGGKHDHQARRSERGPDGVEGAAGGRLQGRHGAVGAVGLEATPGGVRDRQGEGFDRRQVRESERVAGEARDVIAAGRRAARDQGAGGPVPPIPTQR